MKKLIVLALVMGLAGVASAQPPEWLTIVVEDDALVLTVDEGKVFGWTWVGCVDLDGFWAVWDTDVDQGYAEDSLIDYAAEPGAPGTIPLSAIPGGTEVITLGCNPASVGDAVYCLTLADYGIGGDGDGDAPPPPPALLVTASAAVIEEGDDLTLTAAEVEGAIAYDWFYSATIEDPATPKGDPGAELLIEDIAIGDEGLYMCRVNTGLTEQVVIDEETIIVVPIYVRGYIVISEESGVGEVRVAVLPAVVPAVGIIGLGLLIGAGVIGGALRSRKLLVLALVLGLAGMASAQLTIEVVDGNLSVSEDTGGTMWGYILSCPGVVTNFAEFEAGGTPFFSGLGDGGQSGYDGPGGTVVIDSAAIPAGTEEITIGYYQNPWDGDFFECVSLVDLGIEPGGGGGEEEPEAPPIPMLTASAEFIVTGEEFTLTAPLVEDFELGIDDYGYPGFIPVGMVVYTWFPPETAPADSDDDASDNVYTVADAQSAELVGIWKVEYSSGDNIGDKVSVVSEITAAYYTILDTQFIASEDELPAISVIGLGLLVGAGAICGALRARKR